jgi:hypothetical protein
MQALVNSMPQKGWAAAHSSMHSSTRNARLTLAEVGHKHGVGTSIVPIKTLPRLARVVRAQALEAPSMIRHDEDVLPVSRGGEALEGTVEELAELPILRSVDLWQVLYLEARASAPRSCRKRQHPMIPTP